VECLGTTGEARGRWRRFALFLSFFLLTISPWFLRNLAVFGRPVAGTTLTGYNLYRENSLLPSGDYLGFVAGAASGKAIQDLLARRHDLRGTENEAEMNSIYATEGLRIIAAWPLRYISLCAYRFLSLWFNQGVPEAYGKQPKLPDRLLVLEQAMLLLLAIMGMRRLGRESRPVVAGMGSYCLTHLLLISELRFIVPMMPLLMILSAAALAGLLGAFPLGRLPGTRVAGGQER
jgi:hypothetical protein